MQRISTATRSLNKFGAGKDGFTDGDVIGGIPATDLEAALFDNIQEELANIIEGMGTPLNGAVKTQLGTALKGRLIGLRVITSTQTYTPTTGTTSVVVTGVGGGGAGGGAGTTTASQVSTGGGGGGGGWFRKRITSGFSGVTATIGAGGTGVSANAGNAGGTTSFGALASATGGSGGAFGTQTSNTLNTILGQAAAGLGTGGDLNGQGGSGQYAVMLPNGQISGQGGGSLFGFGATWFSTNNTISGAGVAAVNYGSGGGGAAAAVSNGTNYAGGSGATGVIIIEEYA